MTTKKNPNCPRCDSESVIKSGFINKRQRFCCKSCSYFFTVLKKGKRIDDYFVVKALQLYLEGLSFREIERVLGVSHVSVSNWVKEYKITRLDNRQYRPDYQLLNHSELINYMQEQENLEQSGLMVTPIQNRYMVIRWKRLKA